MTDHVHCLIVAHVLVAVVIPAAVADDVVICTLIIYSVQCSGSSLQPSAFLTV